MDEFFATVGEDFESCCPGLAPVVVQQIDLQTGAVLQEARDVPALKRVSGSAVASVGAGGAVGYGSCRFLMRLSTVGFLPTVQDNVVEADGTSWQVNDGPGSVSVIGAGQIVALNCGLNRDDEAQG